MLRFFLAVMLTAFSAGAVCTQSLTLQQYDRETIYLKNDFLRGNCFVKNGKTSSLGIFYRKLAPEFELSPTGKPLFAKARRNDIISFGISIASVAGMLTGGALITGSVDDSGNIVNQKRFNTGQALFWGSAAATVTIAAPLTFISKQQLAKAVWHRNRDLFK